MSLSVSQFENRTDVDVKEEEARRGICLNAIAIPLYGIAERREDGSEQAVDELHCAEFQTEVRRR